MKKYYYLGADGNIHYLGEFENFDDADYHADNKQAIWIIDEEAAQEWKNQLTFLLT